jgi:K319-like protein
MVARARSLLPVERFKTFHKTSPLVKPVVHAEVIWTPLPIPVPVIHDEPYDFPGNQDTAMAWLTIRDLTSSDPSGCLDPSHWVGMVHPDEPGFNGLGLTSFNKDLLPTAEAGEPQRIVIGAERAISLDGGASFDPDGDALAYSWTQVSGPAVTLTEAGTATPNFTMDRITALVTLQFQLSVSWWRY